MEETSMKKNRTINNIHLIKANICRFFHDLDIVIKNVFLRFEDKLKINVSDTTNYGYVSLGPTDDAENVSEYLRAMEWAINDKSITNIALAGPYGAGKSSIINTFLKKHPSIKYINISLAAFRENNQDEIDGEGGNFEKLLEEGILKQLFYKVHYSKIPQSRYRKLHKVSFVTSLLRVLFTLALVISFTFLLAPAKIEEAISAYSGTMSNLLGWNELEQIAFASGFGLIIIIILTSLFRWINTKWKSIEINVADKAFIKADEVGEALSLNKNMDEILYFFEETDYSLVVIEDLDRFDTPEVYTKLREINKIINEYDAIQKRIVFIYALKDDIFHNEDRTKFFDFIIPVVPYIDATNSGEYLKQRLDEIRSTGMEFNITDEYIMNVAPFISDMRVLNSICNEFIVFKKTIKDSQDLGKLQDVQMLSIMIFKNMYPEEFALLQGTDGIVKKAYADRNDFIKTASTDLQKEILDAEEKRRKSDSQEILHAEDVKLAFIQKLVGERGVFTKIQGTKGIFTRSDILQDDFSLRQIGVDEVKVYYRQGNYPGDENSYTIKEIENVTCSDGETYFEKCDRAIARDKKRRKQIAQNLLDKQRQLYELQSKPMKMLIKEYGADEVLGNDVRKNKLLVFMLRHGYIDDTYQLYINYFLPVSITADELNFIINIKNYVGATDWNYRIIHPRNVISRLFDYELEQQKECLNFDLAEFFYGDEENSEKKTGFTKQLAKDDEDSRRFIKEYYVRAKNRAEYIRCITKEKPLFWFDVCSDESLGYQDKMTYLKDIFRYLETEDIVLQDTAANEVDSAYSICSFIVESDEVLEQLQGAGAKKIVTVLTQIKTKFKNINIQNIDSDIIKGIFTNELFEISFIMLQKYADFIAGETVESFATNIYTYILEHGDTKVIEYLDRNIVELVEKVILPIEANTEEDIETIYRCLELLDYEEDFSVKIVQKMKAVMSNLKEWHSTIKNQHRNVNNIVDAFLTENKMVASVENLDTYKSLFSFSSVLCRFVDENIEAFLSDESLDDAHVKEFLKKDIKDETIEKILQNYQMDSFSDTLNSYRENVVQAMIGLKYFKYTRIRYNEILSAFPGMLPLFAKYYWDEFKSEIPSINFDLTIIDKFMESNLDDEKKVVFLNKTDASKLTNAMLTFVRDTEVKVQKKYLQVVWNKLEYTDRPAFLVKHFYDFNNDEIQSMFLQMPDEYHALKQTGSRHNVLLDKNPINESLCKKLLRAEYISSYDIKKEKNILFTGDIEKYVARVRAKKIVNIIKS